MFIKYLLFLTILGVVAGKLLDFGACKKVGTNCTIHSVDLAPCSRRWRSKDLDTCQVSRRRASTFTIHYTPDFKIKKLKTEINFTEQDEGDMSFVISTTEECGQKCEPTNTGVNIVEAEIDAGGVPKGEYEIIWKMWDEKDESKICCFETETVRVK